MLIIGSWNSIKTRTHDKDLSVLNFQKVSVLIPVRNEGQNIETLIQSITDVDYDPSCLEVIVIDDHSSDNTFSIVETLIKQNGWLKIISLGPGVIGKKKAIEKGILESTGKIIVCTDGDCVVPHNWLKSYSDFYTNQPEMAMIFGPVRYKNDQSLFADILNIELSILQVIGGATMNLGFPTMINGANFSYQKTIFNEVSGYSENEHIPSGDDEFLLRKIHLKYPGRIQFLKDNSAIVDTLPPESFKTLIDQRKRWAAKWKYHKDNFSKFLPILIFLVNASSIYALFNIAFGNDKLGSVLFLSIKVFSEFLLVFISSRFLDLKNLLVPFIYLQLIYPFYVVFFGIASNFGRFSWKDRAYNN